MKRLTAIFCCCIFCTALVSGRGQYGMSDKPEADSLRGFYLYTEGMKSRLINNDTLRAKQLFTEALAIDSTLAPAYYELASALLFKDPPQALPLSRRAAELDSANKWYLQLYGQALINNSRYNDAVKVFRQLTHTDAQNPEIYRILAALYEQEKLPFSAIAILDSAELRFGRLPQLNAAKRRLLISTRQYDKAIAEAQVSVQEAPYEAENHVVLGELYGVLGRDSLARVEFSTAMRIDSTDVNTLVIIADYHNRKQDFRSFLSILRRIFELDALSAESKADQFRRVTSDTRFYRDNFFQINELASILAVKYPNNPQIIDLYGKHLIASGELDRALEFYKHHTTDQPPQEEVFRMVIDIESYKQRPDSTEKYVAEAIRLFPSSPEFYISRGHIHSYGNRYKEAVKSYRTSLQHIDTDSLRGVVWGYIGDTYHAAGEEKKSQKAYNKSLDYYRDNAFVLNNYAYLLAEQERDLNKALEMSSRATALVQNNPTFLDTYAWVLFKLGRTAEAKKSMQLAISLDGNSSSALMLHYGDILAASGERFMAEVYWRKALEAGYDDPLAVSRRFEWLQKSQSEKHSGQ